MSWDGICADGMVAILATLFKEFSIELEVGEDVLAQCEGDRDAAWELVRDQTIRRLKDDVEPNVTIQMVKELPLRLVRRSR